MLNEEPVSLWFITSYTDGDFRPYPIAYVQGTKTQALAYARTLPNWQGMDYHNVMVTGKIEPLNVVVLTNEMIKEAQDKVERKKYLEAKIAEFQGELKRLKDVA